MARDVLATAGALVAAGQPAVLATVVWRRSPTSGPLGGRAIIHPDGRIDGWIGGACAEPTIVRQALEVLAAGTARLVHLGPADELPDPAPEGVVCVPIACESDGALQIYLEPLLPPPQVVVIGRTPMVDTLVALAGVLGWRTTVVDVGGDAERHPAADRVLTTLDLSTAGVGPDTAVVVATQGHYDEDALAAALATDAGYVGLVASPRRAARVRDYLAQRGLPAERLAEVHAPAGLDLGPTAHEEIAVAILAELVRHRASGGFRGAATVAAPASATDPVCGMTVDPTATTHRRQHAGRTYYFCCVGCADRFAAAPADYAGVVG